MSRLLAIIGALLLGIVGLFMSLCGGTFSILSMTMGESAGFLFIALPSIALGIFLLWVTDRIFRNLPK